MMKKLKFELANSTRSNGSGKPVPMRAAITDRASSLPVLPLQVPQQLSQDKAKAFEIFKRGYPSGDWIDNQKGILKEKYTLAKSLGEQAQALRVQISTIF